MGLHRVGVAAHDGGSAERTASWMDGGPRLVEMAIGIALVVLSAILILGIVRVVSGNLNIGK